MKILGGTVLSATVRSSPEDVFIHFTGKSIREEEGENHFFIGGPAYYKMGEMI
jgi:hypothetical protein